MAENIRFRGSSSNRNSSLNLILPDFVLCLRDFHLELSSDGKELSENGYLEQCLEIENEKDEKFNRAKKCIKKYFQDRKCFTLPPPGDGNVLRNLDKLHFSALADDFKDATQRFVSYIHSCKPKTLYVSKPINGQMFKALATTYVEAIRQGSVPDVDDAYSAAAKIENDRVEKESLEMFQAEIGTATLPAPSKVLEKCYTGAQQRALDYLRKKAVNDSDGKYELNAQKEMDTLWMEIKERNTKKVREMCDDRLKRAYGESIKRKIESRAYETSGGHKTFRRDIDKLKQDFISALRDYEEHEIIWTWLGFIEQMKGKETEIIDADEEMSMKAKEGISKCLAISILLTVNTWRVLSSATVVGNACRSFTAREDEKQHNENIIKSMIEEHKKSKDDALNEQKKLLDEHYKMLDIERNKQFEKEKEKFEEFVKLKLEKEQAQKELQEMKKQQEEKKKKWLPFRIKDAILNK